LNVSHGTSDEHERMARLVRETETALGTPLAVLVDLPGPKVRLRDVQPDPFTVKPGQRFELRPQGGPDARGAGTTYPSLGGDLSLGDRVLLADGAIELTVTAIEGAVVETRCVAGGIVRSGQGVNWAAEQISVGAVTARDQ